MTVSTLKNQDGAGARTTAAPLLKWPGGKTGELQRILPAMPRRIARYFEPFVGGGAVFFAMPHRCPAYLNDASEDLIAFYSAVKRQDPLFFDTLDQLGELWRAAEEALSGIETGLIAEYRQAEADTVAEVGVGFIRRWQALVHRPRVAATDIGVGTPVGAIAPDVLLREIVRNWRGKLVRMRNVELQRGEMPARDLVGNFETALKSGIYMYVRGIYNKRSILQLPPGMHAALFFFLREYAYAAMFRFNRRGEFNVPYGGLSYNRKDFQSKVVALRSLEVHDLLAEAEFSCGDFETFLQDHRPAPDDFLFLDPPYDSNFSDYDKNGFGEDDHRRLARYLIHDCSAKFQLVIKSTKLVRSLYEGQDLAITAFGKTYMWTIKERNNRDVTHLMITNYGR